MFTDECDADAAYAEPAISCLSQQALAWFRQHFGAPTAAQRRAWPIVAAAENLLLATPTGSGKTLAAFLPIFDQLQRERSARLCVLYIAPLKALVQDTFVTLRGHARTLEAQGSPIRLGLRTGDTSPRVRQHQLDNPPQVLLTTPESLAVLLTHRRAAGFFAALRWIVVDEVHALAGSKRGADLALSMERLEVLATRPRGLQRIGLSATCAPLSTAGQYLAGVDRPCRLVEVCDVSDMELRVEPLPYIEGLGFLNRLIRRLEPELAANRTTLIFTNTRNLTERVTWALRQRYAERADEIAAHHSALAPARRRLVERAMKQGRLWAVVSSASLELGIDIGGVDGVVFVHPPGSIVRLLQRLGRSGHRPGAARRGLALTASPRELLEATVTADCGRHGQIETLRIPEHPFDVLCQHLVGMAMSGSWTATAAYALACRAFPYRNLSSGDFRACLDYLSGRHAPGDGWPPARLRWDGDTFTIAAERTARLLRRNLGTILSEDPIVVRMHMRPPDPAEAPRRVHLGEVDELFAGRLQPGDRFMLDGRCLEYRGRDGRALCVEEVLGRPQAPRWRGAGPPMSNELAWRLYLFRVQAAEALREGTRCLHRLLREDYRLSDAACLSLARYFTQQETISEIPDMGTLLVERLANQACVEHYIHTPLPCPANEALVRVVADRLLRMQGIMAVPLAADLGLVLVLEQAVEIAPKTWRRLFGADGFTQDFLAETRHSALLRDRFAQLAQTGLFVLRHGWAQSASARTVNRLCERRFDLVREAAPDFPLLRQAESEAAAACDLATALAYVGHLPAMQIRQRSLSEPSPFADSLLASQRGPLEPPRPPDEALRQLQCELLSVPHVPALYQ
jgi:ATP-dependent Lhr-like helicase